MVTQTLPEMEEEGVTTEEPGVRRRLTVSTSMGKHGVTDGIILCASLTIAHNCSGRLVLKVAVSEHRGFATSPLL